MAHYEITLPAGMTLRVSGSLPADFDIDFPDKSRANFQYLPGGHPLITHDASLTKTETPLAATGVRTISVSPASAPGPTVTYKLNADGSGPMVP